MARSTFGNARELPSKRWQARWRVGDVWHTAPETFASRKAAERWLSKTGEDMEHGTYVDHRLGQSVTVGELATIWSETVLANRKPSTIAADQGSVDRYVLPVWRDVAVGDVDARSVATWIATLKSRKLAPATIQKAVSRLGQILELAVRDRLVVTNHARGASLPKIELTELAVLDAAGVEKLAATIDPRYRIVVLLGCYAGLRIGEIVGLHAGDVDTNTRRILVQRTTTEVAGYQRTGSTKTKAGRRSVPIPASVADELAILLDGRHRDDYVVEAPKGGPLRLAAFRTRQWRKATAAIGRPELRIHDMRHTAVSLWISAGIDAKRVAAWAGHKSVATVFDRYGHLFADDAGSAMDRLDGLRLAAAGQPSDAHVDKTAAELDAAPAFTLPAPAAN